jgi:hypothetical protein
MSMPGPRLIECSPLSDAVVGSLMLQRELEKLRARGMSDECPEPRLRTFDEQLALIAAGRAHVVVIRPQRVACNQRGAIL